MTTQAILFMLAVWSVIGAATGYCFYKLLKSPRRFGEDHSGSE